MARDDGFHLVADIRVAGAGQHDLIAAPFLAQRPAREPGAADHRDFHDYLCVCFPNGMVANRRMVVRQAALIVRVVR